MNCSKCNEHINDDDPVPETHFVFCMECVDKMTGSDEGVAELLKWADEQKGPVPTHISGESG